MSDNIKIIADKSELDNIANAVREKTGKTEKMLLGEIVSEINGIETGITPNGTISVTENGTYDVTNYARAEVNVESSGGNYEMEDAIITGTITEYTNNRVENIGNYAFYSCTSLTSVNFPACTTIGSNAFYSCTSLTSVNFPACKTVNPSTFYGCTSLTTVSLPVCTTINGNAFRSCTALISLYLTGSTLCSLKASTAFTSTPIGGYSTVAGRYGYVYVPASLLTAYKAATYWSAIADRILAYDA